MTHAIVKTNTPHEGSGYRLSILGRSGAPLAACALLTACANQNAVFRIQDTAPSTAETILIDAKQRPIMVNTLTDSRHPKVCVGRNADAISQAAASGNLKFDAPNGAGGELGVAEAEQATSIAFRTQVTEAQQEYVYYLCQLNSNGAIDNEEVSDNLRHFQNTMLAMIAVDDLATSLKPSAAPSGSPNKNTQDTTQAVTGPEAPGVKQSAVDSDQTGVTDAKNAATSAGAQVTTTLKSAKSATTLVAGQSAAALLAAALKAYGTKEKSYASAITTLQKDVKAAAGAAATVPAGVTQASSAVSKAAATVKSDLTAVSTAVTTLGAAVDATALSTAQADLGTKYTSYQTADTTYEKALDTLASAVSDWATSSGASKGKTASQTPTNGSDAAAASAAVANDVAIIVQTVVWQSYTTEKCLKSLFASQTIALDSKVSAFCIQHLKDADTLRFRALPSTIGPKIPDPNSPLVPVANRPQQPTQVLQPLQADATPQDFEQPAAPDKK